MFKKIVAIMLALIVMLQPMAASAVTWNQIMVGIQANKTYAADGLTATLDDENKLTIDGEGKIEGEYYEEDGVTGIAFRSFEGADDVDVKYIVIGEDVLVNAGYIEVAEYDDGVVEVYLLGKMEGDEVNVYAANEGKAVLVNKGTIEATGVGVNAGFNYNEDMEQTYSAELINYGTINAEEGFNTLNQGAGVTQTVNMDGATINAQWVDFGVLDNENGEGGSTSVTNMGEIKTLEGQVSIWNSAQGGNLTVENAGKMDEVQVNNNTAGGSVNVTNTETGKMTDLYAWSGAEGEVIVTNNGEINAELAEEGYYMGGFNASASAGTVTMTNNGTVNGNMDAYGMEDGTVNAVNNKDVAGSMWAGAMDGGSASVVNNMNAGSVGGGADSEGVVKLENNGKTEYLSVSTDGTGATTVGGKGTAEEYYLYINVESIDAYTGEELLAITEAIGLDAAEPILTVWTEDGEWTDYRIEEDGSLTEIVYGEEEEKPVKIDWDEVYAQMRAEDEALRQSRAVGGVTTSIFWNYQMYLGHSTYNGRVFYQGEKELTYQSLNWLPDGTKNYTLRINKNEPAAADVEIRVAQDILDVCERAGISTITLVDKENNPIAQFAVADLQAVREQYALAEDELLCVSADADAEVMKVTSAGEYLPLEPEAEAEEKTAG